MFLVTYQTGDGCSGPSSCYGILVCMSVEKCQLHEDSVSWRERVLMWSLETSMTWPQEFLQPPNVALALTGTDWGWGFRPG